MSARAVRLIVKQYRFELTAIAATLQVAAVVGFVVLARLPGLEEQVSACGTGYACQGLLEDVSRMQQLGGLASAIASAVGAFGGIVLGVAVVGREVERGTAALAWPLARSRRRWLLIRAVVIAALLAVAAVIPSLVADRLVPVLHPGIDAGTSFVAFETRGLLPVGRDLAALGVGIIAGALFGRVLQGLLLALILAAAVNVGVGAAVGAWRLADAVAIPADGPDSDEVYQRNLILDTRFMDPDGHLLTMDEAFSDLSPGDLPPGFPGSPYVTVAVGIPGDRYPDIDRREAAVWAVLALLLVAASALVVEQRRPY